MLKHISSLFHLCGYIVSRENKIIICSHRYQWREASTPPAYLLSLPASMTIPDFLLFPAFPQLKNYCSYFTSNKSKGITLWRGEVKCRFIFSSSSLLSHALPHTSVNSQPTPILVWGVASLCSKNSFAADLSSCNHKQNMGQLQKYLNYTLTAWEVLISAVNWRQQLAKH